MIKTCNICQGIIPLDTNNYGQALYCSNECRYKATQIARDIKRGLPLKEDKYCLNCNNLIPKEERRDKVYCSKECKVVGVAKNRVKRYKVEFEVGFYKQFIVEEEGEVVIQLSGEAKGEILVDKKYIRAIEELNTKWYLNSKGYARTSYDIKMHRFVAELVYGEIPKDKMVDHKNRNKLDNRAENLRLANNSQNGSNKDVKPNASKYRGVYKNYDKYIAQITIDSKVTHLGRFNTPKEAAIAYNHAALKQYGEFAVLNIIPEF